MMKYEVRTLKDLCDIIIPHFEKYPLLTQKVEDFNKFKEVCLIMRSNHHRNKEGLRKIVDIACDMNHLANEKSRRKTY